MKLFILLTLFVSTLVNAQVVGDRHLEYTSATGADFNTNFILNPSARKNTSSTATSNAAIARVTTAGYKLDGVASYSCDASALNGYCEFTLDTIRNPSDEGNCEFKGQIKGDGTLYQAQILDGSSNVLASTQVLGNQTLWTPFSVNYICSSSRKVRVTQTVAGTAPVIYLGKLYYGKATNLISGIPPNTFTAKVTSAGVVSDETGGDWINGNCGVGSSIYTCNLTSGFFTSAATCEFTPVNSGGNRDITASTISTSQIIYYTYGASGSPAAADSGAHISCTKTGADFLQPTITAQNYNFDWTACPSISGSWVTNTTYTCKYKRQGGDAIFDVLIATSGAPTSATLTLTLPVTIDTARLNIAGSVNSLGTTFANDSGATFYFGGLNYGSTTTVIPYIINASGTYGTTSGLTQVIPFTFGAADYVQTTFRVPVVGWTETQNAPQLLGSVTSNDGSKGFQKEFVLVDSTCSASPCTVTWKSSGVTSVTRASAGNYTINLNGNTASKWACNISGGPSANSLLVEHFWTATLNQYSFTLKTVGLTATDNSFYAECSTPR